MHMEEDATMPRRPPLDPDETTTVVSELADTLRPFVLQARPHADAYGHCREVLANDVDTRLEARPDLALLLGGNTLGTMQDNHRNHGAFVHAVLDLGSAELLAATLPWVYRSYRARGVGADYFPAVIEAFRAAVHERLDERAAAPIEALYDAMLQAHPLVLELSETPPPPRPPVPEPWQEPHEAFFGYLLSGDVRAAVDLAATVVRDPACLDPFYTAVVTEAMIRIGEGWERGELSVAQDPLATSTAGRALLAVHASFVAPVAPTRGGALVATAPGDRHALGPAMVADVLAADGWDVYDVGVDTPVDALVDLIRRLQPGIVCLAASMAFHLPGLRRLVAALRRHDELAHTRIMVGGRAFLPAPSALCRQVGADGWAPDAVAARTLAREFAAAAASTEPYERTPDSDGRRWHGPVTTGAASTSLSASAALADVNLELLRLSKALQRRNAELEQARSTVSVLSGLLPICAHCKKIRDDGGYWQSIETFFRERSDVDFSHGLCPDCLVQNFGPAPADES